MRVIQSPVIWDGKGESTLFLAGGITNCPDWQKYAIDRLMQYTGDVDIITPRQVNPFRKDGKAGEDQIRWENDHLMQSSHILFWFPCEALCPIALFELGKWATRIAYECMDYNDPKEFLFVGVHPDYERKFDVEIQMSLIIPGFKVVHSLDDVLNQAVKALGIESKYTTKLP